MAVRLRLGGLPIEKIALLQQLADEFEAPKHWRARLLIRGAYHRWTEQPAWTGKASIHYSGNQTRGSHTGDLRAVSLEIGSRNERDVREAKFKFGKIFEKVISLPSPERRRKFHARYKSMGPVAKNRALASPGMRPCICNSIL
jgi:hypothetical protein